MGLSALVTDWLSQWISERLVVVSTRSRPVVGTVATEGVEQRADAAAPDNAITRSIESADSISDCS